MRQDIYATWRQTLYNLQNNKIKKKQIFQRTYRNVHQMLKHIVFNQKKAAKKKKCMQTAESRKQNIIKR